MRNTRIKYLYTYVQRKRINVKNRGMRYLFICLRPEIDFFVFFHLFINCDDARKTFDLQFIVPPPYFRTQRLSIILVVYVEFSSTFRAERVVGGVFPVHKRPYAQFENFQFTGVLYGVVL